MGATKINMKPWDDLLDAAGVLVHHADGPAVIERCGVWVIRSGKLEKLARAVDVICESETHPNGALNTLRAKMKRRGIKPRY